MKTELTKKLGNVLGRAAVDMQVGPKAMEMLRYYAVDYEYVHDHNVGCDFMNQVKKFAIPPNDVQDLMSQWDGKKSKCFKGPFASKTEEVQLRVLELNYVNLTSEPVETYWYELHEAILKHRKTRNGTAG